MRRQHSEDSHDAPWVSSVELIELDEVFQNIAISVLSQKLFVDNHLETHIFSVFRWSSAEKASKYISDTLSEYDGTIRVAEIIGNSGTDSTNGPYVQIDEKYFSDFMDLNVLREKASKVNISDQPIHIQAIIKSIGDGKKYYLRDGKKIKNTT